MVQLLWFTLGVWATIATYWAGRLYSRLRGV